MAMALPKKYSAPEITTSRHMRRNEYSLKINVYFYVKADKAENFSTDFYIYIVVHMLSSVENDVRIYSVSVIEDIKKSVCKNELHWSDNPTEKNFSHP